MNTMVKRVALTTAWVAGLALAGSAYAFWNPKDWDMSDGWKRGGESDHPLAPFGWGSKDGRGPFGGENGWGAMDSMADSMGMGDAMSDLNTDVEWDLNVDTQLKGKAHGDGKGSGDNRARSKTRARSDARYYGDNYNQPRYFSAPAAPQGYAPYPNNWQPAAPMGGPVPFAPAMPPMMAPPMAQQPYPYWR
ncbi:MAG: hypothetical protein HN842_08805 [Gammaproteobacteria bacterium]|nr:hypothetical protein [Gammaproteobacteria bacterium]MBT7308306.1 hypothetical protein [Gammaproteobacteria bacterium]